MGKKSSFAEVSYCLGRLHDIIKYLKTEGAVSGRIMRPRIIIGRFLIRLGRFIQSLALMVMKPDDLVEFGRQTYARGVGGWGSDDVLAEGLSPVETALLEKIPEKQGRLLLLGVGGGREAIPLARLGFEVTGVDFVPELVQQAKENAARHGVQIEGLVQEISELDMPAGSFDIVWLSRRMYSCVPTRGRRLEMLRRIHRALRPGGYFICTYLWQTQKMFSPIAELARKIFAFLTRGNLEYEPGDILWNSLEFVHAFSSEAELRSEFAAGGFAVSHLHIPVPGEEGEAVLVPR